MKSKTLVAGTIKIIGIIIVLFFLAASVSCKKQVRDRKATGPHFLESGYSDKYDPLKQTDKPKIKSKYYFDVGIPFKGLYGIDNHFPKKSSYNVIALLDYRQLPIMLNGSSDFVHKFKLSPYQKKRSKLETTPIKYGFHDFIMIVFKDLDNHNISADYRFGEIFFQAVRSNFIAGGHKKRGYPFTDFSRVAYRTNVVGGIIINQNEKELDERFKFNVKSDHKVNYYIHLSNDTKHKKNYALTAFMDASQIDIQGHRAIFTTVDPKTRMVIPASITIGKETKQTQELTVIAIDSPGLPMDDKATQALPGYDEAILESNRVAIFVQ